MRVRESVTAAVSETEDPVCYCASRIAHFTVKADRKKVEALGCFVIVVGATLVTPMLVMLGTDVWIGKILPSSLSLLAAAATAWLQLRKPQQLWALYRTAQRELEHELTRFQFRIGVYASEKRRRAELARRCSALALSVHRRWVPLIPTPEQLKLLDASRIELQATAANEGRAK